MHRCRVTGGPNSATIPEGWLDDQEHPTPSPHPTYRADRRSVDSLDLISHIFYILILMGQFIYSRMVLMAYIRDGSKVSFSVLDLL